MQAIFHFMVKFKLVIYMIAIKMIDPDTYCSSNNSQDDKFIENFYLFQW